MISLTHRGRLERREERERPVGMTKRMEGEEGERTSEYKH